ncbi:hypothetical protein JCGZ_18906 [Jatropha curcas]|uniref:Uncharacterized protein n=1 Tax=Jatropha curcas TaxID=180498 RepID=A0A067JV35_JATCU|nr:hypothetical protein JCGZ_18906 [Jatropha curcas]
MDNFRAAYGNDFYMRRFQEHGVIEAEFAELGIERVMKQFLTYRNPGPSIFPKGKVFSRPAGSSVQLPSWLSEEEVHY